MVAGDKVAGNEMADDARSEPIGEPFDIIAVVPASIYDAGIGPKVTKVLGAGKRVGMISSTPSSDIDGSGADGRIDGRLDGQLNLT